MKFHFKSFLLLSFLTHFCFAQDDSVSIVQNEWKKIVGTQKFHVTKNKNKIPIAALKQIGVDTVSEITKYTFRWKAGCEGGEPGTRLNWAATDNKNWIICYSRGGYSAKQHYEFIAPDPKLNYSLWIGGFGFFKFKTFKQNFLADKMYDPKHPKSKY